MSKNTARTIASPGPQPTLPDDGRPMTASSNGADVSYLDGHIDTLLHNFENGGECKTGERRRADQVNGIWLISYI